MSPRKKPQLLTGLVWICGLLLGPSSAAAAQGVDPDPLLAARDSVVEELIRALPGELPQGAVAILPPDVADPSAVSEAIVASWATAVSEGLAQQRPEIDRVNRETLEAVLREQLFGDSAYADPDAAVEVGRLVSARMLLLTRIQEFRLARAQVRVVVDIQLVDVETGQDLWSRAYHRGIFPIWARVMIGVVAALVVVGLIAVRNRRRRVSLVTEVLPEVRAGMRVDVDGVARAVDMARERLHTSGHADAAARVQAARVELDVALDSLRHSLPGGTIDGSRIGNLKAARREIDQVARTLVRLTSACDALEASDAGGNELAREIASAATAVRNGVIACKRHLA